MKLSKVQSLINSVNNDDEFSNQLSSITQQEYLDLINGVGIKEISSRYILIGSRIFRITDNLLYDSASDYASFENLLMSNKDNIIPELHRIISVYLKPLFRKKDYNKTSEYIIKHSSYEKAFSIYLYLKKKEMKHFYRMRIISLVKSRRAI